MMEQWNKISYIVQLIAACVLFMIHCRKRAKFVPRLVFGSGAFVLLSYWANTILEKQDFSIWMVLYWAVFLLACVFLMYFCLDMKLLQATYYAICACAMQHVAFDVNEIYLWLGGGNPWVQVNQREKLMLKQELDGINNAWMLQKEQYVIKREIIDNINRKCHDLKHQLRALRQMTNEEEKEAYFNEMEQDIMIYDTAVDTGNKALDVILMDKGLFCKNHNIQWTCMADGACLGFMRLEDIYAIFGNALDNAITAVMAIQEPQKRVVSLKMITQNNILVVQVQNYYEAALHFEQGLPLTTKRNRQEHGYGMKSIRYIAEKYGGTITVDAKNQVFTLQILIPLGGEVS